jgi:aminoglycoside phosphotransferase (APT) family kinase protein
VNSSLPTVAPVDLGVVVSAFPLLGYFRNGAPFGSGHINDTFVTVFDQAGAQVRYILQRINSQVFKNVPALMENIARVTAHATQKAHQRGRDHAGRSMLTLVAARDGRPYYRDSEGGWWRCYLFIEGARTHDVIQSPRQASEAARAFGEFQQLLIDLPGERLHETIPAFHHTRRRFESLQEVIRADSRHRVREVADEIAFVRSREAMVDQLLDLQARGEIPERITHNDTKLNNVMIDDKTQAGICVIDLDTVMPGLALYDFGDMVRSATNAAAEDERDLSLVQSRLNIFEALVDGYLASAGTFLNDVEIAHLAFSGRLITFEIGMRFLTDFLQGDTYFKTSRPGQNLDRARNQFALLLSMEAQEAEMESIVRKHVAP